MKSLSVIILIHDAYRNKSGCIEHTILSLINQLNENDELIFVVNDMMDIEIEKLLAFINCEVVVKYRMVYLNTTIAEARNMGAHNASNDVLIFVDEDTIVFEQDACEKIRSFSEQYDYGFSAKRLWTINLDIFSFNSQKLFADFKTNDYSFYKGDDTGLL